MIPGTYNYGNQYRGDTLNSIQFTLTTNSLPLDLTDISIKCQFRLPFKGKTVKEISVGEGIIVSNPESGIFNIEPFIVTWDAGLYMYDIEFSYPSGVIKTYIKGTINIISDQTI